MVDDIASFAQPILILTGGEPLLCPYVWDLIAYAKAKGLKPVVGTNATLVDAAVAARLAAAGVSRISVSIDFPTAEQHDAFRGVPGAFAAAVAGIRAARAAGVEVQVNTTVTRLNRHLLEEIHALAVSLDVQALHPFLLVPTGRGADLADVEMSAAEYEETLRWVCERQKTSPLEFKPTDAPQYRRIVLERTGKMPVPRGEARIVERASCPFTRGCLAGTGFAFISHVGDVQPCGYFDLKLGNVRETPFSRIWCESPVLDDLRHPERLKGKCGVCEYKGVCGGCRARALAKTGDYLAEEPACAHVPDRWLLDELQTDFPLVRRPYAELGARLGLSEDACYARVKALKSSGLVRRIGAVPDARRLGYLSTLVAAEVAPARLDAVAARVSARPGVTHNYARSGEMNLWFTLVAKSRAEIEEALADVRAQDGVVRVLELPATKTYKLRAVFGWRTGKMPVPQGVADVERASCPFDGALVCKLQDDIVDLGLEPFSDEELAHLRVLLADGTVRRFGAVVNHRSVGFVANALTLWRVPPEKLDAAGAALASSPSLSHCYARATQPDWPYNLYAMVHARSEDDLSATVRTLTERIRGIVGQVTDSLVLPTVREYKKTSMRYLPSLIVFCPRALTRSAGCAIIPSK